MITVEFRANPDDRTISGLILPWNVTAGSSTGQRFEFRRHSVFWQDPRRRTMELNDSHDHSRVVGHALAIRDEPEGVAGTFKITDGEMWQRIQDHEVSGFSAELSLDKGDATLVDDVWKVHRSELTGVALTSQPAYVEARIRELEGVAFTRHTLELPRSFASPDGKGGSMALGDAGVAARYAEPLRMPGQVSMHMRPEGAPSGWSPEDEAAYQQRRAAEIEAARRERDADERAAREAMDRAARDMAVEVNLSDRLKPAWRSLSRDERDRWHELPQSEQTAALEARHAVLEQQREQRREHQRALAFQRQQREETEAEQASQPRRRGWLRRKSGEGVK